MEFDKNKIKTKISIAKIKEENDIIMEKKKTRNVLKTVANVIGGIIFGTGVVFAGTKVYENVEKVWNTPKTYEFTEKLSEEDKKDAISEDEAKKKAIDYLGKIGLTKEISAIDLRKNILKDEVIWNIGFKEGSIIMNSNGDFKSLSIPASNYTIPKNYGITSEQAKVVAKELLSKYNPNHNDNEYDLVSLKGNAEKDIDSYIWYASFYKKYGELYNQYEKIEIGWIPTINGLYCLNIENYKYENNEQQISKEEAIRIAREKDEKIETRHKIASAEAEIGIDKMNTEVIYREKNIEEYENGTINFNYQENGEIALKDDAVFYKVENRVRKVWEVTIYYDYYKYKENGAERYVYYVDCTTGEIIGGSRWNGAKRQIESLMNDTYNYYFERTT